MGEVLASDYPANNIIFGAHTPRSHGLAPHDVCEIDVSEWNHPVVDPLGSSMMCNDPIMPTIPKLGRTTLSRRVVMAALLALPTAASGRPVWAQSDSWAALRRPGSFALIRHALAPGNNDPPGFRLDDCATQRNLSTAGRVQAARIGELFRANGMAAADVHSSQWCRCVETATLMRLGGVKEQPLLNSFVQDRSRESRQIEALRLWVGQLSLAIPTVFVTHQVVITALSEIFPGSGEIVVMQRMADNRLAVQGRLPTA